MTLLHKNIALLKSRHPGLATLLSADPTMSQLENFCKTANVTLENLMLFDLSARELPWEDIKFVFLDVDGVLTEGGMFYTETKDEFKRFETKDGMAIKTAMKAGIRFGIISSGVNEKIIQHRADMFGIEHVYVGTKPKLEVAPMWLEELGLDWKNTGYIGDDINDLPMFNKVAIAAAPADASIPNKEAANFVLQTRGGHGCVREFIRYIPSLKGQL